MTSAQRLRPARLIGQTRAEKAAAKRAAAGEQANPKPVRPRTCDDCGGYVSPTEYAYNGGLCSTCRIENY